MTTVRAIIQARMLSTRLRGKSLMPIAGRPLLLRVVERVNGMPFVDDIVIATTAEPADRPIAALATELGVRCLTGDADDVLARFGAASSELHKDDTVVRITADNPLYDPVRSTRAFDSHREAAAHYTHIDGLSHVVPEFIQVRALREACRMAKDPFEREHVTPFLRRQLEDPRVNCLPSNFAGLRAEYDRWFTIDASHDLSRVETMLSDLERFTDMVSLDKCYQWLDDNWLAMPTPDGAQNQRIRFGGKEIGDGCPCFVVAEIGQNHNGEMRLARQLIDAAARCGCDAVKFQKRDIQWDLTKQAYERPYDHPNSFGRTYGEHREFLEFDARQHEELRDYAQAAGVLYFCTACDPPSVDLLERIGNPCYKIASRDLDNAPLLGRVAHTETPVVLSTGMATVTQIAAALQILRHTSSDVVVAHCVSQYPTDLEHVNLKAMEQLRRRFQVPVGLSDHTTGIVSSIAAVALGACYIEKHITLSRAMPGTDHAAALEEEGMRRLVKYVREVELSLGSGEIKMPDVVLAARNKLARSLVSRRDIAAGETLTEEMMILKSPGTGLRWSERDRLIGKRAKHDIARDVQIAESQFE